MYGSNLNVRFNNEMVFSRDSKTFFHMVLSYEIQLFIVSILRWFLFCVTLFCMFVVVSFFYGVIMWNLKAMTSNFV
jgi:hypothetical protein